MIKTSRERINPTKTDWHGHVSPRNTICETVFCNECGHWGCLTRHKTKKGDRVKELVIHHSHYLNENTYPQARNYWHVLAELVEK